MADFKKIAQALAQKNEAPDSVEYIVFTGQKAAKENTLLTYEAEFWFETKYLCQDPEKGITPKVFYFFKGIRNSSKPLYKIKHELNFDIIKEFARTIIAKIENSPD